MMHYYVKKPLREGKIELNDSENSFKSICKDRK